VSKETGVRSQEAGGSWRAPPGLAVLVWLVVGLGLPGVASGQPSAHRLVDAVKQGDTGEVRRLVEVERLAVDSVDDTGATALHWAAHQGEDAVVAMLLGAGASADTRTRYGVTPLALASAGGHADVVDALLVAGADPNLASKDGETPLMVAARTGVVGSVTSLLQHGADVAAREGWRGQTVVMWAAAENHAAIVAPLVAAGADVDARSDEGFTPLAFAVRSGFTDTVEALLDVGADIEGALPDGTSPLVIAVINAHYDVAVQLLERGADPNASEQGWTALHQVVLTRRPNRHYNNPAAMPTGTVSDLVLVRALVAHGADIDARLTAEPRNRYRNALNRKGATPFLLATKAVDLELMQLLLDLGADPRVTNEDGTTPLLVAAGVGIWSSSENPGSSEEALEAVKLMIELGDSVTTVDANGDAALHGAVMRGSKELLQFLLEKGAALNPVNAQGWTPLTISQGIFYANLGRRWPEMEAVLLELGATSPTVPESPR